MKRQGLGFTIGQLYKLVEELEDEHTIWKEGVGTLDEKTKVQINIINKTPECSDTWELEDKI